MRSAMSVGWAGSLRLLGGFDESMMDQGQRMGLRILGASAVASAAPIEIIPFLVYDYIVIDHVTSASPRVMSATDENTAANQRRRYYTDQTRTRSQCRNSTRPTQATPRRPAAHQGARCVQADSAWTTCPAALAACRGMPQSSCAASVITQPQSGYLLRVNVSGRERVHAYTLLPKLTRHAARHLQHRRLGRVVRHPRVVLLHLSTLHPPSQSLLTLFVMLPDIDAIRMMLPPCPNRAICRPAACAVNSTPVVFTSTTCVRSISHQSFLHCSTHLSEHFRGVLQAIDVFLQNPRGSNTNVKSPLLVPNLFRLLPKQRLVSHIGTKVLQPRPVSQLAYIVSRSFEHFGRLLWQIKAVHHSRTRLSERNRHLESEASIAPRHEPDTISKCELVKDLGARRECRIILCFERRIDTQRRERRYRLHFASVRIITT